MRAGLIETALIGPVGKVGRPMRVIYLDSLLGYLESQRGLIPPQAPQGAINPPNPQARGKKNKPRIRKEVAA